MGRSRWDQGLTAAEMKRCHWVNPVMVCQIKFTEWTRDDRLRQPVFLGIRKDKNANEVVREKTLSRERTNGPFGGTELFDQLTSNRVSNIPSERLFRSPEPP